MANINDVVPLIVAPFHFNDYLDQLPRGFVYGKKIPILHKAQMIAYVAGTIPTRIIRRRFRPDIVHNTYYLPVKPPPGAKSILTIHDMIHERFPAYSKFSPLIARWKAVSVAQADHIICVSENTRRDVLDYYGISENKISVVHHGVGGAAFEKSRETPEVFRRRIVGADIPYILYVGERAGYKNFVNLLEAYANSAWMNENFALLCFGGGKFTAQENAEITGLNLHRKILHVGGSDQLLADCYFHASVFVVSSLYEGFGLPVLEAMSHDCPVACSDSSSLPEVAGDAARLFDSRSPNSIRQALEAILSSRSEAANLVERGRMRTRLFSWRVCAEETAAIYRQTLARKR